jgi:hypothetical protein
MQGRPGLPAGLPPTLPRRNDVPDWVVEAGTAEAVAFRLLEKVLPLMPSPHKKEEVLKLYAECLAAVRGPVAEDLLAALNFED